MSISSTCPRCLSVYDLPDSLIGKAVRCKRCEERYTVAGPRGAGDDEPLEVEAVPEPKAAPREARLQTEPRPAPRPPARPAARDDDEPAPRKRPRRRDDDDEDDVPRRRRPAKSGGVPTAVVILGVLGGVFLIVVFIVAGIFILYARSRSANVAANNPPPAPAPFIPPMPNNPPQPNPPPANPPQADPPGPVPPGGIPPGAMPPGAMPGAPPQGPGAMPGGGAANGQVMIELSNARRDRGIGARSGFQVDYRVTQGALRPGRQYYMIVRQGGRNGEAHLIGFGFQQSGTISISSFGPFGLGGGAAELYMEASDVPGPFGNRQKISNSVNVN